MKRGVKIGWPLATVGATAAIGFTLGTAQGIMLAGLLLATCLILPASRHPRWVLATVLIILPMQYVVFPLLLRLGMPADVVRQLNFTKEWALIVLAVGIFRQKRCTPKRSVADAYVAGFVGIAALYLLLPILRPGIVDTLPFAARSIAFRTDCIGVLLFLVVRRLHFDKAAYAWLSNLVIGLGVILAVGAMIEEAATSLWTSFLVNVLDVATYRTLVFGQSTGGAVRLGGVTQATLLSYADFGSHHVLRPGSFFVNPLVLASYLLVPFGLALARSIGRRGFTASLPALVIGIGIILTLTRSAVLAAAVMTFAVLIRTNASVIARSMAVMAVISIAVLVPSAQTLSTRSIGESADTSSTDGHIEIFYKSIALIRERPLGLGLGIQPGSAQRVVDQGKTVITETSYLQFGVELGLIPMALFILAIFAVYFALRKSAGLFPGAEEVRIALIGVAVMGLFLEVWLDLATSVTIWSLAGVALRAAEATSAPPTWSDSRRRVSFGDGLQRSGITR